MSSKGSVCWLALMLACVACCPSQAMNADAPPWLLVYKFVQNKPLRYKLTADIKASIPLGDSTEPADLSATITLVYKVAPGAGKPDGSTAVALSVESASAELEKIPFDIPVEQVQKILDQTVTLARTGEVLGTEGGQPIPFTISVPGVDPKRLYALLFPIVFQSSQVNPGDTWSYKSELLGGDGADPEFKATVLKRDSNTASNKLHAIPKGNRKNRKATQVPPPVRLREEFKMDVLQNLNSEKQPAESFARIHRTRKGSVEGDGVLSFDRTRGLITKGYIDINANITDDLVGEALDQNDPKQIVSKVKAKVTVELVPAVQSGVTKSANGKKAKK